MNDEQADKLLQELASTRESFDKTSKTFEDAVSSIRWNRINTIIQYCLIVVVFLLGALGFAFYSNEQREECEEANLFRITVVEAMEENAFSIGAALAIVFNASDESLNEYLQAYTDQHTEDRFPLREC